MKHTIEIQNLKCGGCAHTITTKIGVIDNISNVEVNVDNSTVDFQYENDNDVKLVETKLSALGYPKQGEDNSGISKAKSFVSCAIGKVSK
jgi:copper chaperone CopZ